MINTLSIKNYKSIVELNLSLGHFNVFIGENGCGKSNILESLCLAGAAATNKLDNELLLARGVRLTTPQLMRSSFPTSEDGEPIGLSVGVGTQEKSYAVQHTGQVTDAWFVQNSVPQTSISQYTDLIQELKKTDLEQNRRMQLLFDAEQLLLKGMPTLDEALSIDQQISPFNELNQYRIYSPESSSLRRDYAERKLNLLGLHGEGTLGLITSLQHDEQRFQDLCESLEVFDWFDHIELQSVTDSRSERLAIQDYYANVLLDHSNMSDGFLYVLFYLGLVISPDTPSIFAIDHFDTTLNPKLCTKLTEELSKLAKKYNKQVLVTTHNPGVLDGLDLLEDHLFVVSRNAKGHTRAKQISLDQKPVSASGESMKLSEAFLRGYLGGLPKGF